MSEESKSIAGPFDVATVKQLVELMDQFEINEIDLRDGDRRVLLRRGSLAVATTAAAPAPMAMPMAMPPMASPTVTPAAASTASAGPLKKLLEIKSPMVGTFYAKPAPDKDDYVKVGTRISEDSVVCKIEAMKIFNDLPAGISGTIVEVLAQNSQFVEYDQVLFRVEPL